MHSAFKALLLLKKIKDLNEKNRRKRRSCSVRAINRDRKTNGFFLSHSLKLRNWTVNNFLFIQECRRPFAFNYTFAGKDFD